MPIGKMRKICKQAVLEIADGNLNIAEKKLAEALEILHQEKRKYLVLLSPEFSFIKHTFLENLTSLPMTLRSEEFETRSTESVSLAEMLSLVQSALNATRAKQEKEHAIKLVESHCEKAVAAINAQDFVTARKELTQARLQVLQHNKIAEQTAIFQSSKVTVVEMLAEVEKRFPAGVAEPAQIFSMPIDDRPKHIPLEQNKLNKTFDQDDVKAVQSVFDSLNFAGLIPAMQSRNAAIEMEKLAVIANVAQRTAETKELCDQVFHATAKNQVLHAYSALIQAKNISVDLSAELVDFIGEKTVSEMLVLVETAFKIKLLKDVESKCQEALEKLKHHELIAAENLMLRFDRMQNYIFDFAPNYAEQINSMRQKIVAVRVELISGFCHGVIHHATAERFALAKKMLADAKNSCGYLSEVFRQKVMFAKNNYQNSEEVTVEVMLEIASKKLEQAELIPVIANDYVRRCRLVLMKMAEAEEINTYSETRKNKLFVADELFKAIQLHSKSDVNSKEVLDRLVRFSLDLNLDEHDQEEIKVGMMFTKVAIALNQARRSEHVVQPEKTVGDQVAGFFSNLFSSKRLSVSLPYDVKNEGSPSKISSVQSTSLVALPSRSSTASAATAKPVSEHVVTNLKSATNTPVTAMPAISTQQSVARVHIVSSVPTLPRAQTAKDESTLNTQLVEESVIKPMVAETMVPASIANNPSDAVESNAKPSSKEAVTSLATTLDGKKNLGYKEAEEQKKDAVDQLAKLGRAASVIGRDSLRRTPTKTGVENSLSSEAASPLSHKVLTPFEAVATKLEQLLVAAMKAAKMAPANVNFLELSNLAKLLCEQFQGIKQEAYTGEITEKFILDKEKFEKLAVGYQDIVFFALLNLSKKSTSLSDLKEYANNFAVAYKLINEFIDTDMVSPGFCVKGDCHSILVDSLEAAGIQVEYEKPAPAVDLAVEFSVQLQKLADSLKKITDQKPSNKTDDADPEENRLLVNSYLQELNVTVKELCQKLTQLPDKSMGFNQFSTVMQDYRDAVFFMLSLVGKKLQDAAKPGFYTASYNSKREDYVKLVNWFIENCKSIERCNVPVVVFKVAEDLHPYLKNKIEVAGMVTEDNPYSWSPARLTQ